ncbi:MAG: hypothetical protein PHU08_00085 [Dehalococcoidales bacterium]|nr:hypothetical protein [Dehalococcoidales bacterium]
MATDLEILKSALDFETRRAPQCWDAAKVGAGRADINRLLEAGLITQRHRSSRLGPNQYGSALYRLTDRGRDLAANPEQPEQRITAAEILAAMDLIVGFDDIKEQIAYCVEQRKRTHFLLEGPPACCKSVLLDALRGTVPGAMMVFGSRTSGKGLSDLLFEQRPILLLMDEADKMRHDVFSLTLGLMEAGEIINTKQGDTRGVKLNTMVIGACNSSRKMPPEFLSRFAFHPVFPHYTREEFIDVVRSMLSRAEDCPEELAEMIGRQVFDNRLGDVRQARGVWQLMREPTEAEAIRVLRMKAKYSTGAAPLKRVKAASEVML